MNDNMTVLCSSAFVPTPLVYKEFSIPFQAKQGQVIQEEIQLPESVRELSECPDEPLMKTEEVVQLQSAYNDDEVWPESTTPEKSSVHNKVVLCRFYTSHVIINGCWHFNFTAYYIFLSLFHLVIVTL